MNNNNSRDGWLERLDAILVSWPALLLAYLIDFGSILVFMLTLAQDDALMWISFGLLALLIATFKLRAARQGALILWFILMVAGAFSTLSFFVTRAAPDFVVIETQELKNARHVLERAENDLKLSDAEIKKAIDANRLSLLKTTLTPENERLYKDRNVAQTTYDSIVSKNKSLRPTAIEVFERPFLLLAKPGFGTYGLLIFGLIISGGLEGILLRIVRPRVPRPRSLIEEARLTKKPITQILKERKEAHDTYTKQTR